MAPEVLAKRFVCTSSSEIAAGGVAERRIVGKIVSGPTPYSEVVCAPVGRLGQLLKKGLDVREAGVAGVGNELHLGRRNHRSTHVDHHWKRRMRRGDERSPAAAGAAGIATLAACAAGTATLAARVSSRAAGAGPATFPACASHAAGAGRSTRSAAAGAGIELPLHASGRAAGARPAGAVFTSAAAARSEQQRTQTQQRATTSS